jgi:hypothetical protein
MFCSSISRDLLLSHIPRTRSRKNNRAAILLLSHVMYSKLDTVHRPFEIHIHNGVSGGFQLAVLIEFGVEEVFHFADSGISNEYVQ